jgi:hypothetical protein
MNFVSLEFAAFLAVVYAVDRTSQGLAELARAAQERQQR